MCGMDVAIIYSTGIATRSAFFPSSASGAERGGLGIYTSHACMHDGPNRSGWMGGSYYMIVPS